MLGLAGTPPGAPRPRISSIDVGDVNSEGFIGAERALEQQQQQQALGSILNLVTIATTGAGGGQGGGSSTAMGGSPFFNPGAGGQFGGSQNYGQPYFNSGGLY